MKRLLKLLSGVAAAAVMSSAQAINVGGVVWDPNSIFDFTSTDTMIETAVFNVGDTLNGYALINNINGTPQATFCPGCELTYVFTGYTVSNVAPVTGALTFTGGTITVRVDSTPNWDASLQSTATDGVIWLVLSGTLHIDQFTGLTGTLHSDPTPAGAGIAGDGRGFLDVSSGLAAANFDTNTMPYLAPGGGVGFADFQFTSSFQLLPNGCFVSDDGRTYCIFGSNDLQGDSIAVPEPSTMLLAGLALLGLGAIRRRTRLAA